MLVNDGVEQFNPKDLLDLNNDDDEDDIYLAEFKPEKRKNSKN